MTRTAQRQTFTSLSSLADFLELTEKQKDCLWSLPPFSLQLPLRIAQKITKKSLDDPLLKQFVPHIDECVSPSRFCADPLNEHDTQRTPRLLQKYEGRALLLVTNSCAMHCRFCFRKAFPLKRPPKDFSLELDLLQKDPTIHEVILSGGDPLALSPEKLRALFAALGKIRHIRRLRIHTRFPIGFPERIDKGLLQLFAHHPQQIIFVIHINHPRELDQEILHVLRNVKRLDIPVLTQTVLLKGVNDQEETLLTLYETLIDAGIIPYYLHLLDPVIGSAHFDVPMQRGQELIAYLRKRLSGYGVPRLVYEQAGALSKLTCG